MFIVEDYFKTISLVETTCLEGKNPYFGADAALKYKKRELDYSLDGAVTEKQTIQNASEVDIDTVEQNNHASNNKRVRFNL
jgi:hypothetical protein